mmetsp:Transcript_22077/g.54620  ORF Transcript_22077/g.54620 Transcript_22077/m.54620 type:complete len:516 (+) Transcript_22077:587-2134(+)
MTIEFRICGLQVSLQLGTQGRTFGFSRHGLLLWTLGELKDGKRLRLRLSTNTGKLNVVVANKFVFDRCRSNIFTLGSLEDFLGTSSNLKTSFFVHRSLVSSANVSICGESLSSSFRVLVVSHHRTRRLDLNFTICSDTAIDVIIRVSDVSDTLHTRFSGVRVVEILSHTVTFQKVKSQATVPIQKVGRKGSTSGTSESHLIESKTLEKLLLDENVQKGDAEQNVKLRFRQLGKDSGLEFCPKTRDRQKESRLTAVKVGNESGDGLGVPNSLSGVEWNAHSEPTFHTMGNRQIRKVTIIRSDTQQLANSLGSVSHGLVRRHDTLWLSSTSGRVNNGRHFVLGSGDGTGNGRSGLDDIGPGLGMQSVRRTERERDSFDAAGDSFLHFRPRLLVELSDENHFGFGMLQNVTGRIGSEGGVNRNRDVTGKPNTQVSNDPIGAVLGADCDLGLWWISKGLDVSSDLLRAAQNIVEGEGQDFIPAHRLGQESLVAKLLDIGNEVVNNGLGIFRHGCLVFDN